MISCEEAVRRLWEHVERTATPREAALLEEHLALCRRCCGEAGFAAELRGLLRRTPAPELPGDAAARLEALVADLERAL